MDLLSEFQTRAADLLPDEGTLLLALSGGADSVCLAHLLLRSGIDFEAAHCNYGLRGAESDEDEAFVRVLCAEHQIQLHVKAMPLEGESNIQARARKARYAWFRQLVAERNLAGICTAHHADDNLENLFIALLRGSGLKGLAGMWPVKGDVYHPLLFARRAEVEGYLKAQQLDFREDSSNASTKYLRNRVRHELLPLLEDMRQGAAENLIRDQRILRDQLQDLEEHYEILKMQCVVKDGDRSRIDLKVSRTTPGHKGFLHFLLQPYGFTSDNIQKALTAAVGSVFFASGHQLYVDREQLLVQPVEDTVYDTVLIERGQQNVQGPVFLEIEELTTAQPFSSHANTAQFDLSKLEFPLELRPWRHGDRIQPLGMEGSKLVSDLLIDEKMPLNEKEKVLVLCSGSQLIWVLGLRISERSKVQEGTKRVLLVRKR